MSVAGICMVKDEADIIERTIWHMLGQVDWVFVLDNDSTDGTTGVLMDILDETDRLSYAHDPEVGYYQSEKMSALAARAQTSVGVDWVVPFDADELWYSPHGRVGDFLEAQSPDVAIVRADLYNHYGTAVDLAGHPFDTMAYRAPDPGELPKVAARTVLPVVIEQGNHGAHYPAPLEAPGLVVRHFPYRSADQMIRKARNGGRAYAATNLPEHVGEHWRSYARMGDDDIADWYRKHFWYADPSELVYDPAMGAIRAAGG